jgi:hypothetical protein
VLADIAPEKNPRRSQKIYHSFIDVGGLEK